MYVFLALSFGCSSGSEDTKEPDGNVNPNPQIENEVDFYLTKGDQSQKFQKQSVVLSFENSYNNLPFIKVEPNENFQTIKGFGFSLTGGSAEVINSLSSSKKQELLQRLFNPGENGIGISFLRLSIGASDLDANTFSYNDLLAGEADEDLSEFSLAPDKENLIPLLNDIIAINPEIGIIATPWSPPTWMKDNKSTIGGSLLPEYYDVYARYLVKYVKGMADEGISIEAITPQNEPLHPENNPSMYMSAQEQADFIKNSLGPAFETAGLKTDIIIYDHNADKPEYPISVLNDAGARKYIAGSAFHLYAGDISSLSKVHAAYPEKDIYFTEQYTGADGDFGGDLKWHLKNVIIGSMRNWSKTALEWNLANNADFGPHTDGGCTDCKGAITVNNPNSYQENVGFYIIAHASKFVPRGSVRIASNIVGSLQNVAFRTPDGKKVLIVLNDGNSNQDFNIEYNGKWFLTSLNPGSVGTFVWE